MVMTISWTIYISDRLPFWSDVQRQLNLAGAVKHIAQSSLLQAIHAEAIVLLNLDPRADVFALVRGALREPFGRVPIALGAVAAGADGQKLRTGEARETEVLALLVTGMGYFSKTHSLANWSRRALVQDLAPDTQASLCDGVSKSNTTLKTIQSLLAMISAPTKGTI